MVKNIIQFLIKVLKGREFKFDEDVTIYYIFNISLERLVCIVRGLLLTGRFLFVGQGSKILGTKKLKVNRGVEIGRYCSIDCMSRSGLSIGRGSKIGDYSIIKVSGTLAELGSTIQIGDDVGIGDFCHIGGSGGVIIGSNTICGAYVSVHPENHLFSDPNKLIREQGVERSPVTIGENCWIGAKSTFLAGSGVGNNCIVAAGSVLTKRFPDDVIVAGIPAKVLRTRK